MGLFVPEAAGVGADLVRQNDRATGQSAELQLEVHQRDAALCPEGLENVVDGKGVLLDGLDLLRCGQLQRQGVIAVQQGISQFVVLVGELDGGSVEYDALLHTVPLGEGPGREVADDNLQRHDGDLLHQGLPLTQLLNEVGGNAGLFDPPHQMVGHLVVDDALARNGALLQAVEGGGVVLVVHDVKFRVVGAEDLLGLSLIELFQLLHGAFVLSFC